MIQQLISILDDMDRMLLLISNLSKLHDQLGLSTNATHILRICFNELLEHREHIEKEISCNFATIGPTPLAENATILLKEIEDRIKAI
jgi:hypothetical protein